MRSAIEDIENNNGKVKGRILGCSSHKLNKAESSYTVYELELLAIDKVLEQYEYWLIGSAITIVTDHDNLSKLEPKVQITPRIARTVEFMLQFNVQICFMEGTSNALADGLSRYPIHRSAKIEPSEVELFKHKQLFQATLELCGTPNNEEIPNQIKRIFTTTKIHESEDKIFRLPELLIQVIEKYDDYAVHDITGLPLPLHDELIKSYNNIKLNRKFKELSFQDDKLIYYKEKLWIPQSNYEAILWIIWSHHIQQDQHPGISETKHKITRRYRFEYLSNLTRVVVNSCTICQVNKPNNYAIANYHFIPTPSEPHGLMSLYHITDLPKIKDGYDEVASSSATVSLLMLPYEYTLYALFLVSLQFFAKCSHSAIWVMKDSIMSSGSF